MTQERAADSLGSNCQESLESCQVLRHFVLGAVVIGAACGGPSPGGVDAPAEIDAPAVDAAPLAIDCNAAPTAPPAALGLDPFYVKYVDAGIPVIGSASVRDAAFAPACEIVSHMLALRPELRERLLANRIRVGIMAETEVTTDMPEHSDLNEAFPGTDWDARARGLGATIARPLTSCGEENLLALNGDRYAGESILVHEFGHTTWDLGVRLLAGGSGKQTELSAAFQAAITAGTFANTYAATNVAEYWAEGVQSWFNTNLEAEPANGIHNSIDTRVELRAADAELARLVGEVFLDDAWQPPPY